MGAFLRLARDWLRALGPWRLAVVVLTAVVLAWAGPQLAATKRPLFDIEVLRLVHKWTPDVFGHFLPSVYEASGKHLTAVLVLAVMSFLVLKRFWAELICLMVGTGGILLIVDRWLKPLFDRRRPTGRLLDDISGRSFPSGHAAGSVVFYFLTCCLLSAHYPRLRKPLFLISSFWVGLVWFSTLYCRAHWLTDIAAGAAVGYVWLSFCLAGFTVWEQHNHHRSKSS